MSANAGEIGQSGRDLRLGATPGLNTGDDLLGEFFIRAEARGITVRGTLGGQSEPGVQALGHSVGAR